MERMHAYLAHCALASLLGLWPGYAVATDVADNLAVSPSHSLSGVESRAVPSLLQPRVASLQQRLTQLEADARDTQAALNQPGTNTPMLVSARFPQLAALARQAAIEARAVRDQARVERQAHLATAADRLAADNDAISRGMEEARSKAQQATQAATVQLLAGVIGSAIQMKGAAVAMQGTLSQNAAATPVQGGLVSGGGIIGAAGAGAAAEGASAGGAGPAAGGTGAGAAGGGPAGVYSGVGAAPGGAAGSGAGPVAGNMAAGAGTASRADAVGLDQQIRTLQQQVHALQTQIAALQSIFKIAPNGAVTILSPTSVSVQAGTTISIGAGQNVSIQSSGTALIDGKGGLDLKGAVVKLNGGAKPLATVGSQVQVPGQPIGQVTTGNQTVLAP